jgi:predicted DNA binding CopG/RHH family protein
MNENMKASTWRRKGVKTMRTSIEIPEEVWVAAKIRAAQEKTNLQEVIAAALHQYLRLGTKKGGGKDER